jgi:hypothetical protein
MPKNPLSLCLLTSTLWFGASIATIAQAPIPEPAQETPVQAPTPAPASSNIKLTLEDLPAGFQELPPEVAAAIASNLEILRQQLTQANIKPENFFAFVNQENFQIVLGFTGNMPSEPDRAKFDASLQEMQNPEAQQKMLSLLRERLKGYQGLEVVEYKSLPELNSLGNASSGMSLALKLQQQPVRMDVAAFRRNRVGALTAVIYTNGKQPLVPVGDVVRKLDGRILQVSPAANLPGSVR